ncbi:MAG: prepilin-type N-terminal cleavage/methylation domain-containing protein [Nitrospira sp.]|nr:prepilin-type N-terminal cleavage/methylation domain-containing protein [Nitrospira sp.]
MISHWLGIRLSAVSHQRSALRGPSSAGQAQAALLSPSSLSLMPRVSRFTVHGSPLASHPSRSVDGFTILEMLIVLFLLGGILAILIPRFSFEEDLRSTGRTLIAVLRTLQGEAAAKQTPLKLYFDLDRGLYWMMLVEGKEERLPLDPGWKIPRALPESIRLTEVSIGQDKHVSGRADVSFFTNGRIEPVTMYLMDSKNNLLGLAVDSLTGGIRVSEERFDIPRTRFIPDRVRTLLKPRLQTGAAGSVTDGLPKPSTGQDASKQTPNQR